jgi:hypothetical protein
MSTAIRKRRRVLGAIPLVNLGQYAEAALAGRPHGQPLYRCS